MGTLFYSNVSNSLINAVGWRKTLQIMAIISSVSNTLACLSYGTVHHSSASEAEEAKGGKQFVADKEKTIELQSISAASLEDRRVLLKQDSCVDESGSTFGSMM